MQLPSLDNLATTSRSGLSASASLDVNGGCWDPKLSHSPGDKEGEAGHDAKLDSVSLAAPQPPWVLG